MTPWAKAIKRRLAAWGWTQRQLAAAVGAAEPRVSDWIKGRHEPSDEYKARLVELMDITAAEVAPKWLRDATVPVMPPAPEPPTTHAAAS